MQNLKQLACRPYVSNYLLDCTLMYIRIFVKSRRESILNQFFVGFKVWSNRVARRFCTVGKIVLVTLQISLPFQYEWYCQLFKECANLVFFITTGVKFRPASDNPYLQLAQYDSEEEEMEEV